MDPHISTALDRHLTPDARRWLTDAEARVGQDPAAVHAVFPAVGRRCGRGPLLADWTVADAARARLLAALPLRGATLAEEVTALHHHGDVAEQRAVLRSLALLEDKDASFADLGLPLVREALRGNDTDLMAAALGPYAARHLDHAGYRQAVLKCVFCGLPLDRVAGLTDRADRELARMPADFAHERVAARRATDQLASELARLENETGRAVRVGFEPEPGCVVENTVQAARELGGVDPERLGTCLDTCHLAVQFEEPAQALRASPTPAFRSSRSRRPAPSRPTTRPTPRPGAPSPGSPNPVSCTRPVPPPAARSPVRSPKWTTSRTPSPAAWTAAPPGGCTSTRPCTPTPNRRCAPRRPN